jgi:hypothetical protein
MNVETGELKRLMSDKKVVIIGDDVLEERAKREELRKQLFQRVPDELAKEAEKELGEKDRVFVDLKKKTPLTNWANSKHNEIKYRKDIKKKHRKMSKASRKRNRK